MKTLCLIFTCLYLNIIGFSQSNKFYPNAHAHNDYEHKRPLKDALEKGFASVEADVHLNNGKLVVAHDSATMFSPSLESLYLAPLDSILRKIKSIFPLRNATFFLMIDLKTEGQSTFRALKELFQHYPSLLCHSHSCPVKILLSGELPVEIMVKERYDGFGIDGQPKDLRKGYSFEQMPVISDTYRDWAAWDGLSKPTDKALQRVEDLAQKVHAEGKKLRL